MNDNEFLKAMKITMPDGGAARFPPAVPQAVLSWVNVFTDDDGTEFGALPLETLNSILSSNTNLFNRIKELEQGLDTLQAEARYTARYSLRSAYAAIAVLSLGGCWLVVHLLIGSR